MAIKTKSSLPDATGLELDKNQEAQLAEDNIGSSKNDLWKLRTQVNLSSIKKEYELLASNEIMLVEKNNPKEVEKMLLDRGLTKETVQTISELVSQNQELIKKGEIPASSVLKVEPIRPIKSSQDLSQIANGLENAPKLKKTIPDVTRDNYTQVVEELFDLSDIDSWLRNPDGTKPNAEQKAEYIKRKTSEKKTFLDKLNFFDNKFGSKNAADEWLKLFNNSKNKLTINTRENARILLVDSNFVIFYKNSNADLRPKIGATIMSSLGEMELLTNPNIGANNGAKLSMLTYDGTENNMQYFILSSSQINASIGKDGLTDLPSSINNNLKTSYTRSMDKAKELTKLDKGIEDAKERGRKADEEIRKANEEIRKSDHYINLNNKSRELSNEIEKLVKEYIEKPNNNLKNIINNKIAEMQEIKKIIDSDPDKKRLEGVIAQYNVAKLRIDKFRKM